MLLTEQILVIKINLVSSSDSWCVFFAKARGHGSLGSRKECRMRKIRYHRSDDDDDSGGCVCGDPGCPGN